MITASRKPLDQRIATGHYRRPMRSSALRGHSMPVVGTEF
jgi:hypothetical protein